MLKNIKLYKTNFTWEKIVQLAIKVHGQTSTLSSIQHILKGSVYEKFKECQ